MSEVTVEVLPPDPVFVEVIPSSDVSTSVVTTTSTVEVLEGQIVVS